MTNNASSISARDIAYTIHPYTNARMHEEVGPLVIESGKGIYVYDVDGREYIEGLAGLWCVAVGFGEERLVDAAQAQLRKLSYYHNFTHKSHPSSISLAETLIRLASNRTSHVFYTNSGSEANDTVVKLIWFYNNAAGRPKKKKIISRIWAFHGVTLASASLTGLPWMHRGFNLPLPWMLHASFPHHYRNALDNEDEEAFATRLATELEELILAEGPETIAAFIGEPVMGAAGVVVPPVTYWEKIQEVCWKYDVLIIADEVINGFGRTGQLFGSDTYGIDPDVMVLSKQMTSGYQPLAAVLITEEIYSIVADYTAKLGTLGHGFTSGGNPVSTAVAIENIKIIEERELVKRVSILSPLLIGGLRRFSDHPLVGQVRGVGLMAAVELIADKKTREAFNPVGSSGNYLSQRCQHHGLIVRNVEDTIAFCPPLIIEEAQIEDIIARFELALDDTFNWVKQQ